jgi:hypothetical protein
MKSDTVETVNGHAIHKVQSGFGQLFAVGATNRAFKTMEEAKAFASATKPGVSAIKLDDIGRASQIDDVDAALLPLMNIAGIDDGGVAGIVFSGFDWSGASIRNVDRWLNGSEQNDVTRSKSRELSKEFLTFPLPTCLRLPAHGDFVDTSWHNDASSIASDALAFVSGSILPTGPFASSTTAPLHCCATTTGVVIDETILETDDWDEVLAAIEKERLTDTAKQGQSCPLMESKMTREELMAELVKADGAILYWKLPEVGCRGRYQGRTLLYCRR